MGYLIIWEIIVLFNIIILATIGVKSNPHLWLAVWTCVVIFFIPALFFKWFWYGIGYAISFIPMQIRRVMQANQKRKRAEIERIAKQKTEMIDMIDKPLEQKR